ncbi:MAG: hypothetical protein ACK41E_05495 [Deinococcales bacterium]
MSQQQLLEQFETTANRVLETIHELQAGELGALQRLQAQISNLSAEHQRLEAMIDAPVYLGG